MQVKVKIKRNPNNNNVVEIQVFKDGTRDDLLTTGIGMPNVVDVLPHIDPRYRRTIARQRTHYGDQLNVVIRNTPSVPLQDWSTAIGEVLLQSYLNTNEAESELSPISADCYMNVGNYVYRLHPVALAKTNKALSILRSDIVRKAKDKAESLLANAKQNLAMLNQQIAIERAIWQRERAAETSAPKAPGWCVSHNIPLYPTNNSNSPWAVGMLLDFSPTTLRYAWDTTNRELGTAILNWREWTTVPNTPAVPFWLWLPIKVDGTFQCTSAHIHHKFPALPHVNHDTSCMAPADIPKSINSLEDYNQVTRSIERTLKVVALHSLLHNRIVELSPLVQAFFPPEMLEFFNTHPLHSIRDWHPAKIKTEVDGKLVEQDNPLDVPTQTKDVEQEIAESWSASV